MGVSTECFTFYGVKLEWNDEFVEAFDDHYEQLEDYVLIDGMGGDYIVIGAKLFESGDSRWDAMSGFEEIDVSGLPERRSVAEKALEAEMPDYKHLWQGEWKLMSFVHYS